jgi:hypothetical protein
MKGEATLRTSHKKAERACVRWRATSGVKPEVTGQARKVTG